MKKIDRIEQYKLINDTDLLYQEVYKMYLDGQVSHDELNSVKVHLWRVKNIIMKFGVKKWDLS